MVAPQPVYRKDYKPTPYLVDQVHLTFQLSEESTTVLSELAVKPNYAGSSPPEMSLNGILPCLSPVPRELHTLTLICSARSKISRGDTLTLLLRLHLLVDLAS